MTIYLAIITTVSLVEDDIKTAKAEAYKEFAEELEQEIIDDIHFSQIEKDYFGVMINNLLKEMVGEK